MHQLELDHELADGVDATSSPALQARARQLQTRHFRKALVAEIDTALAKAEHPPHWHSASLPVRAAEVRGARAELEALRQALAASTAPAVQPIALAACLINDPNGPLYHAWAGADIAQLADRATDALTAPPQRTRRGQSRSR
jgi:hypothetical protein